MNLFDNVYEQSLEFEKIYNSELPIEMKTYALINWNEHYENLYAICGVDVEDWNWPENNQEFLDNIYAYICKYKSVWYDLS